MIAQKLTQAFNQQFLVDNRPGAGGIIGSDAVAKSAPDGYTVLVTPTSHAINPSIYAKLPYDTVKDFAPVALLVSATTVFVVHPSLPARTINEVVALAKAQPGKLSFGSAGKGHLFHLTGELFKTAAKIDIVHVPYKGGSPAITNLVGGEVSLLFETMQLSSAQVKPPASASRPPAIQARTSRLAEGMRSAIIPVVRKTAEPMTFPITSEVAPISPISRFMPGVIF